MACTKIGLWTNRLYHSKDNPFDNKTIIESIPKRSSPAGKKASAKRRRNKIKPTNDPDINLEIQQHGEDNVHIIQDTNP
jgi:hypothetical protein